MIAPKPAGMPNKNDQLNRPFSGSRPLAKKKRANSAYVSPRPIANTNG